MKTHEESIRRDGEQAIDSDVWLSQSASLELSGNVLGCDQGRVTATPCTAVSGSNIPFRIRSCSPRSYDDQG